MLVVLVATLTGILGLLGGLLATALLLAGLVLAAALLVLAALTTLSTLLVLTALTGILRILVLWILAHRYSLSLSLSPVVPTPIQQMAKQGLKY